MTVDLSRMITPAACCQPLDDAGLTPEDAEATAALFKALADPTRVRIVNLLARSEGPACVCDLTPVVGVSQPTVSHHLKKLTEAGLLEREQRGRWAYFTLNRDAVDRLAAIADLKGACC
jgi:ArsR family transcriptional regulator